MPCVTPCLLGICGMNNRDGAMVETVTLQRGSGCGVSQLTTPRRVRNWPVEKDQRVPGSARESFRLAKLQGKVPYEDQLRETR